MSPALAAAALGGLLCLGASGCISKTDAGGQANAGPDSGAVVDAAANCAPDGAAITSSHFVTDMTVDRFTTECDARGGQVEIHPHCGGANSCRGMSYDEGTQILTQHTCKAMNTCAGYSCVIPC